MCDWWEVNQSGQMLQCQQHLFRLEKTWLISLSSQTLVAIGINGYFFQANIKRVSAKFRQILMSSLHPLPMKIKKNKSSHIAVHAMCQRRRKQKKFLQTTSGHIYQLDRVFLHKLIGCISPHEKDVNIHRKGVKHF